MSDDFSHLSSTNHLALISPKIEIVSPKGRSRLSFLLAKTTKKSIIAKNEAILKQNIQRVNTSIHRNSNRTHVIYLKNLV